MIVVDASAIGTFLVPDEAGPFAEFARDTCLTQQLHVPAYWHVEGANLIAKARRRGRMGEPEVRSACIGAAGLAETSMTAPPMPIDLVVTASERLNLTAYDVAYLLLAQSLRVPLLTDDGALRRAARAEGVQILLP